MTDRQTRDLMRKAVPLARKFEGDWTARMKLALKEMVIRHYLMLPLTSKNYKMLLAKGCTVRRICKHYGVNRHHLKFL